MIAGYEMSRRAKLMHWVSSVASLDLPLNPRRINYYLAGATLLGICAMLLQGVANSADSDGRFGAIIQVLRGQLYLAIVLLAYRFYSVRYRTILITNLFYLSVVVAIAAGLSTGFLEQAAAPLVLVAIVRWHQMRKFPLTLVICLLITFGLLNSVKANYRSAAWYGSGSGGTSSINLWWNLLTQKADTIAGERDEAAQDATDTLLHRFDSIHKFVWVLKRTPSSVPFYEGATYSYLIYGWIPRIVWPDKPSASEGAAYRVDLDYQLITEESVGKTNIGIGGFLPESFANFGTWGVFFIMTVQGVCFALLDRLLNGPHSQGGQAIYLTTMFFFLNGIGSSTVTLFGALLQIVIAYGIILRFFRLRGGFTRGVNFNRIGVGPPPFIYSNANSSLSQFPYHGASRFN